ncbi:MAG: ISKra4-like element ISKra4 family transposase, partial [Anaerolineales bacterium]
MQLLPGQLTPALHESLVRLGTWMPFARAATELGFFSHVRVGEATVRRVTETAGAAYVAVQTEAVDRLEHELPPAPDGPEVQLLSVDGAMVPLLHKEWAEVKTLAVGSVTPPVWVHGEQVVHTRDLSYFSRLMDADTFGRLALVETHRRGTERAGTVCALSDGAEWAQGFIDLHRPDAVRILDFAHAAAYVAKAGQAVWGEATPAFGHWLTETLHELKHGSVEAVFQTLRDMQLEISPRDPAPATTIQESLNYLEKRRTHLDYARFQASGYPIGSGSVESANKLVVEARLKGAGMHWARPHVDPMLALRT